MSLGLILVGGGCLFLILVGMALGLAIAHHQLAAREYRQASYQQELNAERARIDDQLAVLDARDRSSVADHRR